MLPLISIATVLLAVNMSACVESGYTPTAFGNEIYAGFESLFEIETATGMHRAATASGRKQGKALQVRKEGTKRRAA